MNIVNKFTPALLVFAASLLAGSANATMNLQHPSRPLQARLIHHSPSELFLEITTNGGASWTRRPVKLPRGVEGITSASMAFDMGGNLHIIFAADRGRMGVVNRRGGIFVVSTYGSAYNFRKAVQVFTNSQRTRALSPQIAVDTNRSSSWRNHVYVVWLVTQQHSHLGELTQIFFSKSVNRGRSFLAQLFVNQPGQVQTLPHKRVDLSRVKISSPSVSVNSKGHITVEWLAERADRRGARLTATVSRTSLNGGLSFRREIYR